MNRYPWWKYLIMALALVIGLLYTLPNFFGEAPAVQVSSGKSILKIGSDTATRVEQVLKAAGIAPDFVQFEPNAAGSGVKRTHDGCFFCQAPRTGWKCAQWMQV